MRQIITYLILGFLLFGNAAFAADKDPDDGGAPTASAAAKLFGDPLCKVVNLSNAETMVAVGGLLTLTFLIQVLFGQFQMAGFMKVTVGTTVLAIIIPLTDYFLGARCVVEAL